MTAALSLASTIPAPASVKECACGRSYDASSWKALARHHDWDNGYEQLDGADCVCGSTLYIIVGVSPMRLGILRDAARPQGIAVDGYGPRHDLKTDLKAEGLLTYHPTYNAYVLTPAGVAALEGAS